MICAQIIQSVNDVSARVGYGPIIAPEPTPEEIQSWLAWNDPDGEWGFVGRMDAVDAASILCEVVGQ